jgi:hypothetical protein
MSFPPSVYFEFRIPSLIIAQKGGFDKRGKENFTIWGF